MKKILSVSTAALALVPTLVAAQSVGPSDNLPGTEFFGIGARYAKLFVDFTNGTLIPLLFAVIFLYFAYAMFNVFVKGGADEEAKKAGTKQALNAIIGAVLILSFWGLVNFVANAFGAKDPGVQNIPRVQLR